MSGALGCIPFWAAFFLRRLEGQSHLLVLDFFGWYGGGWTDGLAGMECTAFLAASTLGLCMPYCRSKLSALLVSGALGRDASPRVTWMHGKQGGVRAFFAVVGIASGAGSAIGIYLDAAGFRWLSSGP